jgi:hypothetical protein
MNGYRQKRDANHSQVADHLRRVGCDVLEVMKPLDLLVCRKGETVFIEVKIAGSAAKWTATQLRFIANTRFNVIVAKTGEEASRKMRDRRYLTQTGKDRLAALLALEPQTYYTPAQVEKALAA